jgi:hypothetical protein
MQQFFPNSAVLSTNEQSLRFSMVVHFDVLILCALDVSTSFKHAHPWHSRGVVRQFTAATCQVLINKQECFVGFDNVWRTVTNPGRILIQIEASRSGNNKRLCNIANSL